MIITGHIVVSTHIVTVWNDDGTDYEFASTYSSDWDPQDTRDEAIDHGLDVYGHDDFCVAEVRGGVLVDYGWMDNRHPHEDWLLVAEALHLEVDTTVEPESTP